MLYRDDIDSSSIKAIAYEEDIQVLYVTFKSTAVYCYEGVSPAVVTELLTATSKGYYFSTNIRGIFPTRQLEPDEIEELMHHITMSTAKRNSAWLHTALSIARMTGYREVLF